MEIEIQTVVAGRGMGLNENEYKGNTKVIEMFYVLMRKVDSWMNTPVKIKRTVFKNVHLTIENYTSSF